jgi:energy-coupling factor transporter ATP-binding protein EcfA2
MSGDLRFESIELHYGCLHGRQRFPGANQPTVIVGSNGTGKSTLIEAVVRTLFGFNRREPEARLMQECRRPWKGGSFRAVLLLEDLEGRLVVERDFETNDVVVSRPAEGEELYRGEANPAAPSSSDQRGYRELLQSIVGLVELEDYERTACIQQGHMLETELTQDLLRIAAGGHADVEAARESVRGRYHELTLEPINAEERRRRKKGRVERLAAELDELEIGISTARRAEAERSPLLAALETIEVELSELRRSVRRLEREHAALSRLRVLEEREEASLQRIRRLEDVQKDLSEAIWKAESAADETAKRPYPEAYPEDYLERLAALEEGLWPRLEEVRATRDARNAGADTAGGAQPARGTGGLVLGGGVLLAAGAWAVGVGEGTLRLLGLVAALAGAAILISGLRGMRRRGAEDSATLELTRIDSEIETLGRRVQEKLAGLPAAGDTSPDTLPERRREFALFRSAVDRAAEAERRLAEAHLRTERTLASREAEAQSRAEARVREESGEDDASGGIEAARALLSSLDAALSSERNDRLAPTRLELERERSEVEELPEDARTAFRKTDSEMEEKRQELTSKEAEERELRERFLAVPRPDESSLALEGRLEALRTALAEARREAGAYRRAHGLLVDAYEEFRETDQERLLRHIDAHLTVLGDRKMGPVVAPDDLDSAQLMYGGRSLALASPPLSYGELHVALFAVRMGAADFLAGMDVRLPLIVDDPFVHLDADRAAEIWDVLCTIARERQVILTTQDRLVLEHLGIRPDLDLDGPARGASAQMELPVGGLGLG